MKIFSLSILVLGLILVVDANPAFAADSTGGNQSVNEALVHPVATGEEAALRAAKQKQEDEEFNRRRLLRMEQLWNLHIARLVAADGNLNSAAANTARADAAAVKTPQAQASMPVDKITAVIRANAVVLEKALATMVAKAPKKTAVEEEFDKQAGQSLGPSLMHAEAVANLHYLKEVLLKNLENRAYFGGSRARFRNEFREVDAGKTRR